MGKKESIVDVAIIGAGPAGLFAAFNCGMRGLSVKIIEASEDLGGKVARFYPEKSIYDIGAVPEIKGDRLVKNMVAQAFRHQPEVITGRVVGRVEKDAEGIFCLTTDKQEKYYSRTVIACCGMGRYQPVPLDVKGAGRLDRDFLHYMFPAPGTTENAKVAIYSQHRVGVEWAISLQGKAKQIYLINSETSFSNIREGDLEKLESSSTEVFYNTTISSIEEKSRKEKSVLLSTSSSSQEQLDVNMLLVYAGIKFSSVPFEEWGIQSKKGRIEVNAGMESSLNGFYAAGDAAHYPGKSMLIANGYTEAITAVNSAALYLDSNAPGQVYSTVVYRDLK